MERVIQRIVIEAADLILFFLGQCLRRKCQYVFRRQHQIERHPRLRIIVAVPRIVQVQQLPPVVLYFDLPA